MSPYLLLLILWVLYFFLHSLFARPWMKAWFAQHLPWLMPHYRLLCSIGAALGLIGILFYNAIISHQHLLPYSDGRRYVGLMLSSVGVIVLRLAFRVYSFQAYVGLKTPAEIAAQGKGLKTGGILSKVRHPLYLSALLLVSGLWLYIPTLANLVSLLAVAVYTFIGIWLQERDLLHQYGERYREYQKNVPMLVPRLIGKSKENNP